LKAIPLSSKEYFQKQIKFSATIEFYKLNNILRELRGIETQPPPSECEEKAAWTLPAGGGGGLEGANTMFATGRQFPLAPLKK